RRARLGWELPGRAVGLEAISDSEDHLDVLIRVPTQLLAEPPDVHVQDAGANVGTVTPDLHQQGFPRNDFANMLHQEGEKLVLLAGEDHAFGVQDRALMREIQDEVLVPICRDLCCVYGRLKRRHFIPPCRFYWYRTVDRKEGDGEDVKKL